MKRSLTLAVLTAAIAATGLFSSIARAQYPTPPSEVLEKGKEKASAANRRSDEAWARAQDAIKKDAENGRPYISWASHPMDLKQGPIPAFPGAWGGGMYTVGGRGGKVMVVTSLEDSGPGTFREACDAGGARIVIFNVSGIIRLKDRIRIRAPYISIIGSSAPGDGVCIAGNTVELESHDIIIRHMRFRRGSMDVTDRNDSCGGNPIGNVMIDHCSSSWGLDENMSMYRHMTSVTESVESSPVAHSKYREMYQPKNEDSDLKLPTVNITIQNSIFSEGLNTFDHAFGSTIGGRNSTFHHNLWACNTGRNPSVGMDGDFGLVNNVIFNWRHRSVDGGDFLSCYNIINNYFKPGPGTPKDEPIGYRILKPEQRRGKTVPKDYGHAYVGGNIVEGNERVTKDNWDGGVQIELDAKDPRDAKQLLASIQFEKPFPIAPLPVTSAQVAFTDVLANAGALLPVRDAVDVRVTDMVRTGNVTAKAPDNIMDELKSLNSGFKDEKLKKIADEIKYGYITNPNQVGGYPDYKGTPYKDSDSDGMPDDWELAHGLNPNDPSDAAGEKFGDGYTNIEHYLYKIDDNKKVDWRDLQNNVDTLAPKPVATAQ